MEQDEDAEDGNDVASGIQRRFESGRAEIGAACGR